MKGFFIFYSTIMLIVFCLMNQTFSNENSVYIYDTVEDYTVTISGAVLYPNDYVISSDTYVFEVLRMANLADNADLTNINLYEFVTNKSKIVIPYGIININTAEVAELTELIGVGETTANKIIAYREETPFTTIEDLKNIGSAIYTTNAHRITV